MNMLSWTYSGSNNPKNSSCTATRLPSHKLFYWDEQDMQGTAGLTSKDELINNILLWTPTDGRVTIGQIVKTYRYQICWDTGCNLKDFLGAIDGRDGWQEKIKELHVVSVTYKINPWGVIPLVLSECHGFTVMSSFILRGKLNTACLIEFKTFPVVFCLLLCTK